MPIDTNAMGDAIAAEITAAEALLGEPLPTAGIIRTLMMQALARGISTEVDPAIAGAAGYTSDYDFGTFQPTTQQVIFDFGEFVPYAVGGITYDFGAIA